MAGLRAIESRQQELDHRLLGLEYALEESVPQLVGSLVLHLARQGVLRLDELEADIRKDFDPDPGREDSTGALFATLAALAACYRRDGADTARYSEVYERVGEA